jgi:DNA repair/transcription protein MET18/MMS19
MALLINKWNVEVTSKSAEGESIKDIIARQMVFTVPDGSEQRSEDAVNGVIQGAVCVTNAVNLKGGAAVKPLLELLVDALSSPNGGAALAKRFKFPFLPPDIFCKENAVVMRGLYKQRPFAICFPKLLDQYKSCTDQNVKSNYLVALSGILENTPSEVILPEIEQLMPVLLQAMDSPNQAVKAASIKVLSAAIGQSSSSIEGHIRSVILRLLTIAQQPSKRGADITLKVRLMALKCLADVPLHLKKVLIEPYVAQVLRELERPLSDGRRDVREGAVKCRYTWFKLITLTEEED